MALTATSPASVSAHTVAAGPSLAGAYASLFKLRVSVMVVITAAAGLYLGDLRSGISPFHASSLVALAGIALVTCGSSALNQALERQSDGLMRRTARRPMVTGQIGLAHGILLGFAAIAGGSMWLAYSSNLLTGTLTLLTAASYVGIYTPLKRFTTVNTFIGAFPGALPPLIGWTSARGLIEWPAVALFAVLFVWQFPHFMAIGWMYRDDYREGGIRLTATQEPLVWAGRSTAVQALFYAMLMLPVSLWTTLLHVTGTSYAVAAVLLSSAYLGYTIRFGRTLFRAPDSASAQADARLLLKVSVIYLPLLLIAMIANAQGRVWF